MLTGYTTDTVKADVQPDTVYFERMECTKAVEKTAAKGSYYAITASNSDGKCGSPGTSTLCSTAAGCTYTTYEEEPKEYSEIPKRCEVPFKVYRLKGTDVKGVYGCNNGASDKCKINYWQVDIDDVESYFPYNHGYTGLKVKIETNPAFMTNSFNLYTTEIGGTGECTSSIQNAVNKGINAHPGAYVKSGNTFNKVNKVYYDNGTTYSPSSVKGQSNYRSMAHAEESATLPSNKLSSESGAREQAQTTYNNRKKTAEMLESIGRGCENYLNDETSVVEVNPSANFHYVQVYLNGENKKQGPEFVINYGSTNCPSTKTVSEISPTAKLSGEMAPEEKGFIDISDNPLAAASLRNAGEFKPDEVTKIRRASIEDAKWILQTCKIPEPTEDATNTLYPGPQVVGFYENQSDGHGRHLMTSHKLQYAVYLTTYEAKFETWWDIHGLGFSPASIAKFTKAFNEVGNTCANQGDAFSRGTAEKLLESAGTVPFTCYMEIEQGGLRVGHCYNGKDESEDIKNCTEPAELNQVFEFKVVDPKDMFPNNQGFKLNSNLAANWKKDDNTFGPTYNEITSRAKKDETYAPSNLTYAYKLDTAALGKIKNYNKSNSYESFNSKTDCTCNENLDESRCGLIKGQTGDCTESSGSKTKWKYTCRECKSDYITNELSSYWNNSKSLAQVRASNHWA